jgi:hypothetical protein
MGQANRKEHRRAATRARVGRDLLPVEWIVLPAVIILVVVVGFGLKVLLG